MSVEQGHRRVRGVVTADRQRWSELYSGYLEFYRIAPSAELLDTVWAWLLDPSHRVHGLVAVDPTDRVVGLAHYQEFADPSSASTGGYLDDLFVDPVVRGEGHADALLSALRRLGAERGWSVIRWITAEDNYRARSMYDRYAVRTSWVTYDMDPAMGDDG